MRTRLTSRLSLLFLTFAAALLVFPAMAFAQVAAPDGTTTSAPTIQSDKDDYAPGELVTLTGSGWQDGESVNIVVNDDEGQTWNRNVNVTADASGNIRDSFSLPDWFVAAYSVKATGSSGTATTSFTDARVVTNATLNGGNSVNVTPGGSITANVTVQRDGSGANVRWESTGWRVANAPGSVTCVNHADYTTAGTSSEQFSITAPTANGTYNAYFVAYSDDACSTVSGGGAPSVTFTISNGVVVKSNQATLNYTGPTTGAFGDKLTLSSSGGSGTGAVTYEATGTACELGTGADAGKLLITSGTGTCSVTAKKAGDTNYNSATSAAQTITVNKATTTTTVSCGAGPFTYTGTAQTPCSASVSGPGLNNQAVTPVTYTNNTNAGTATASATYVGTSNYNGSSDSETFTIGKAQLSVNAKNQSTVYGDNHLASSYELSGFVNGQTAATAGVTGAPECSITSSATNVGTYPGVISCTTGTLDAANYSFASGTNGDLTITKRPITVTPDAGQSKTYGDIDPTLEFHLANNTTLGHTDTLADATDGALSRASGKDVGTYAINQGTLAATGNYSLSFVANGATFEIKPKPITGSFTADDKEYDGNASATVLTRSLQGVLGTDAVSLTGGTATFADKNVGNGKVVTLAGATLTGAAAGNYNLTSVGTATANITARGLLVTATGANKTYDGTTNATVSLSDNRVSGDVLSTSYASASFSDKNAGTGKVVDVSGISVTGADAGNYTFNTTTTTSANIAPRPITVTADAKTKLLGADDPALTYKVTSGPLVTGDSFSGQLSRVPGETVGTYAIQQGTLTAGSNYDLKYIGANLTILFKYSGFLQPINDTAHQTGALQSKFRLGQTIPVKFIISDAAGTPVQQTTNPTFTRSANRGACDSSTVAEAPPLVTPESGNQYTFTGGQYHFNWSTKGLSAGEYRIYANLADGTQPYVDICLTK